MERIPWQLMMLDRALKKSQKLSALRKHVRELQGKECLLITCGDNNGAMNYRIREWGGRWSWAELEETHVRTIEELLGEFVVVVNKDNCKLPFPNDSFDCIVTIDCHEHLVDPHPLNDELWRVSRPGAKVVITVPNGNTRKLAVRIKHLVGMSKAEYGHVVVGYDIPNLVAMLQRSRFAPCGSSSYSRFFTEMVELGINFVYVKILAKKAPVRIEEGTIAPTSEDQFRSVSKSFRLYEALYPLLRFISGLDRLLFFTTGYAVVVEARKT